jgi:hypothetical protein
LNFLHLSCSCHCGCLTFPPPVSERWQTMTFSVETGL